MEEENKKLDKKLSKYVDPTGELPSGQLKLAELYLRNKILLQQIGLGFLIAFCIGTVSFSLWKWGEYLFFGYAQDQKMFTQQLEEAQNYEFLHSLYRAQDLVVADVRVFRGASDTYDFVAIVTNPNKRWIANFKYHFNYSGGDTNVEETVLLPGVKRPLVVFGYESNNFPSGMRLVIDEISWKSIDPHKIPDVAGYINTRSIFSIDSFIFNPPSPGGILIPSINFDLYNDSAYSYWQPIFYVELLSSGQTVGYVFLSVDKFLSGEKRAIDLRYFGDNITVTDIRLHSVINVFDENEYILPNNN